MKGKRLAVRSVPVMVLVILVTGCTVSVHAGYYKPSAGKTFVAAVGQPMKDLTAAASAAGQSCAGGSRPDPARCYADTTAEVRAVNLLEHVIRTTRAPASFGKANALMIRGLGMFASGLTQRNQGLKSHSPSEYEAGDSLITQSLRLQRTAFADYPAGSGLSP